MAAVAVPQAMAYASIFGMPVEYGLYTAIVMTAVGALFDSSKQLINGPTNVISIALLSALAVIPAEHRIQAAVVMAFLVGLIQTGITLLRLGDLSRYISHAVIVGFTAGASTLLILDQLKNALGLKAKGEPADHFLKRFYLTMTDGGSIHFNTLVITVGTIGAALLLRWINRRFRTMLPELFLAIVIAGTAVWCFQWESSGVKLIEKVPRSLPSFQLPSFDWEMIRPLMSGATAIALLGLLESIAMAKAIAAKTRDRLDINQQCLSEGLANLTGSFFHCFPGSGSLTRSYINHQSGAATQWSGVISAAIVALTMYCLGAVGSIHSACCVGGRAVIGRDSNDRLTGAEILLPRNSLRRHHCVRDRIRRGDDLGRVLHLDWRFAVVPVLCSACGADRSDRADLDAGTGHSRSLSSGSRLSLSAFVQFRG